MILAFLLCQEILTGEGEVIMMLVFRAMSLRVGDRGPLFDGVNIHVARQKYRV